MKKKDDFLVIIPAYNEATFIESLVSKIKYMGFNCLVIDDGSEDKTFFKAKNAGAIVLKHPFRLGAWLAIQTGMYFALKQGFKGVVSLDADGQHIPYYIPSLITPIKNGLADVVIGSYTQRLNIQKRFICWFWRRLTGVAIKDITSGFRAYNQEALRFLCTRNFTLLEYQDLGVLLFLQQANFRIYEVPVFMKPRHEGRSRIFSSQWHIFCYLIQTALLGMAKRKNRGK